MHPKANFIFLFVIMWSRLNPTYTAVSFKEMRLFSMANAAALAVPFTVAHLETHPDRYKPRDNKNTVITE